MRNVVGALMGILILAACATAEGTLNPFGKPYTDENTMPKNMRMPCKTGENTSLPILLFGSRPLYPVGESLGGREGPTVLTLKVTEEGKAKLESVQGATKAFENHVAVALTDWKFTPAMKAGKPVEVDCRLEFNFRLRRD